MLNAKEYKNTSELVKAIHAKRDECYSQYNRNPSVEVVVHEPFKGEYYVAHIHWHPFEKYWILGVGFHGMNNQGQPYYDSMAAKSFKSLRILVHTILIWNEVGTPRINLSIKRWKGIK